MGADSGSTNRWKTARERNRLKARFEIQSRVSRLLVVNPAQSISCRAEERSNKSSANGRDCENHSSLAESLDEMNIILKYIQAVIKNDVSTFSVASLACHQKLHRPLPNFASSEYIAGDPSFGLSCGIPKKLGAETVEQARFALQQMISTNIPWNEGKDLKISYNTQKTTTTSNRGRRQLLQSQPATLATSK